MDWKEYYKSRVVTAEEALSQIQDGEMVMPSHAAAEPKYLTYKMVEMKDRFHNVGILQGLTRRRIVINISSSIPSFMAPITENVCKKAEEKRFRSISTRSRLR